jgi:hypothetical protein
MGNTITAEDRESPCANKITDYCNKYGRFSSRTVLTKYVEELCDNSIVSITVSRTFGNNERDGKARFCDVLWFACEKKWNLDFVEFTSFEHTAAGGMNINWKTKLVVTWNKIHEFDVYSEFNSDGKLLKNLWTEDRTWFTDFKEEMAKNRAFSKQVQRAIDNDRFAASFATSSPSPYPLDNKNMEEEIAGTIYEQEKRRSAAAEESRQRQQQAHLAAQRQAEQDAYYARMRAQEQAMQAAQRRQ